MLEAGWVERKGVGPRTAREVQGVHVFVWKGRGGATLGRGVPSASLCVRVCVRVCVCAFACVCPLHA